MSVYEEELLFLHQCPYQIPTPRSSTQTSPENLIRMQSWCDRNIVHTVITKLFSKATFINISIVDIVITIVIVIINKKNVIIITKHNSSSSSISNLITVRNNTSSQESICKKKKMSV